MRSQASADKITALMAALGREVTGSGRIYLTGGATALLHGWRDTTVDVDLKADPEPPGWFEAIATLKEELDMNIELAAPDQFIPALPGWRDRSRHIAQHGRLEFYHYDFYSQALAKLERGHARDLADVQAMMERQLIAPAQLWELFLAVEPLLVRFPGITASLFRESVARFCARAGAAV
jgi:hypothetical protein